MDDPTKFIDGMKVYMYRVYTYTGKGCRYRTLESTGLIKVGDTVKLSNACPS